MGGGWSSALRENEREKPEGETDQQEEIVKRVQYQSHNEL